MYFTKEETLLTFKEIHQDELKQLHGQKKIKDSLFKSHVHSLIEAKLLNPIRLNRGLILFRVNSFLFKFI